MGKNLQWVSIFPIKENLKYVKQLANLLNSLARYVTQMLLITSNKNYHPGKYFYKETTQNLTNSSNVRTDAACYAETKYQR